MFGRLLRVFVGYLVACIGAGLTLVLFVVTPSELAGLPPDVASDRVSRTLELASYVAAQAFLFAAPFALVVAAIGEWRHNRNWIFYTIAGILIAVLGFLAQHSTEQAGQPTIVNNYAAIAFATAGFVAGLLYWLFSGRRAGGGNAMPDPMPTSITAGGKGATATGAASGKATVSAVKPGAGAATASSKPTSEGKADEATAAAAGATKKA